MGEETDGVVESVSKLQDKVKSITGVDILDDNGAYRSTYEILLDLAEVWDEIGEKDPKGQAAVLELLAGKNRANALAAILTNVEDLKHAYESALEAEGSALRENEAYLESIQGRIDIFTNAVQTAWSNIISTELIKSIVDIGTALVETFGNLPGVITAASAALGAFVKFKTKYDEDSALGRFFNDLSGPLSGLKALIKESRNLSDAEKALEFASYSAAYAQGTLTSAQYVGKSATLGLKEAVLALIKVIQANPMIAWATGIAVAITIAATAFDHYHDTAVEAGEAAKNAFKDMQNIISSTTSTIRSLEDELEAVKDQIKALDGKAFSFADKQELQRLKQQKALLESSLAAQNDLLEAQKDNNRQQAVIAARSVAKTQGQGAEKERKEIETKITASWATAFAGIGAAIATVLSGGTAAIPIAIGTGIGGAVGGFAGNKIGEAVGDSVASNDNGYIGWYETYASALELAKQKEQEALREYQKDTSNIDKLEKWQEAQEKTSEIEASMYNHLSEMQTYINALDPIKDKAEIDEYYDMIDAMRVDLWEEGSEGGKDAKYSALDRIFGENASEEIQTIKEQIEKAMESGEEFDFETAINSSDELKGRLKAIGISVEDVKNYFTQLGESIQNQTVITNTVETYSALTSSIESYNEVLSKTSEIVSDNTEVSQEYKDSLIAIGISQEELSECFDENNGLIVKNATLLNKLVKQKQQDVKATIQQAKAYSQLQYKTIIEQIGKLVNMMAAEVKATGYVTSATLGAIGVFREQLSVLQQTIQQYALLELSLSNAAKAYREFEAAKERDAQLTYGDSMVEMLGVLNEGFKTGQVGTEAFQFAVKALVPPEFYKDIEDAQEKMQSIHDYVDKNPVFADYFTIDEGQISITMDNIKAFLHDGLNDGIGEEFGAFIGDIEDFDLAPHIQSVKDLADAYSITEAAALAMITEFSKYDASWGDIITRLTTTGLDRAILDSTTALEEAITAQEEFIKSGQPLYDENGQMTAGYKAVVDAVDDANNSLNNATQAAINNANTYTQAELILKGMSGEMKYTQEQADALARSLGLVDANGHITINPETGALVLTQTQIDALNQSLTGLEEPTILDIQLAYDDIYSQVEELKSYLSDPKNYEGTILSDLSLIGVSEAEIQAKLDTLTSTLDVLELYYNLSPSAEQNDSNLEKLLSLETNGINIVVTCNTEEIQGAIEEVNAIQPEAKEVPIVADPTEANANIDSVDENNIEDKKPLIEMQGVAVALQDIGSIGDAINALPSSHTISVTVDYQQTGDIPSDINVGGGGGGARANGNFHVSGNAFASGTVGAPSTETALVGELGTELIVDPSTGRWHTVGDRGAEFTQIKRGQIIFNHLQTKQLLENGYVTSRGKLQGGNYAFASGTAYGFGIFDSYVGDGDAFENGSNNWVNPGENAFGDMSDDVKDTSEQVVDFIEIKLEKIENMIAKTTAHIENLVDDTSQIIQKREQYDKLIAQEKQKANVNSSAASYYASMAESLLDEVPSAYRDMAKNGAIAVEEFVGEGQTEIAEAIEKYREYSNKADEAEIAALEAIANISALRLQAIEDIADDFDNLIDLIGGKSNLLQASMDLVEESGERLSKEYYDALIKDTSDSIEQLEKKKDGLIADLNAAVKNGEIKAGSDDWYTAVNLIMDCNEEIINCKQSVEEFNNAILDLKWDNLDKFITELDNVESQLSHLLGLISDDDQVVDEMGEWTDEGITSLGLFTQQMELAQYKAQQYGEAITELKKDYQNGLYSTDEYNEKLAELTENQWDSIEAYEKAKDELVNLNKVRINAVKNGMQKEIDAYKELIDAKKESLNQDKEAHDFEKNITEKNKKIATIQRQLAAIANNDSTEAAAKRKQLQAELAEANADLDEFYYDHSIQVKQDSLDKEYDNFQNSKNKEMESLDEWLKDQDAVISESLEIVKQNTNVVLSTINSLAQEHGVQISTAVIDPWKQGESAISDYSGVFNSTIGNLSPSVDAFVGKLNEIKDAQDNIKISAQNMANSVIESINSAYDAATQSKDWEGPPVISGGGSGNGGGDDGGSGGTVNFGSGGSSNKNNSVSKGDTITVNSNAPIYDWSGDTSGEKQYFSKDPVYTVLKEEGDRVQVRWHGANGGVTGWINKSDIISKHAKGTLGTPRNELALIDELGEELVLNAGPNGRLQYLTKGTSVIPANLTERLMEWGELDPSEMLRRSAPVMSAPHLVNNNFNINLDFGSLVHIDNCSESAIPDVQKLVKQEVNNMVKGLNQSIKRYTR